jgi:hypothetical protein
MRLEPGRWWLHAERIEIGPERAQLRAAGDRLVPVRGVHRDGGLYVPGKGVWEAVIRTYAVVVRTREGG